MILWPSTTSIFGKHQQPGPTTCWSFCRLYIWTSALGGSGFLAGGAGAGAAEVAGGLTGLAVEAAGAGDSGGLATGEVLGGPEVEGAGTAAGEAAAGSGFSFSAMSFSLDESAARSSGGLDARIVA
jgi:hypothetical protein